MRWRFIVDFIVIMNAYGVSTVITKIITYFSYCWESVVFLFQILHPSPFRYMWPFGEKATSGGEGIVYSWPLNNMGLKCAGPLTCTFFSINIINVFSLLRDFLNIFSLAYFIVMLKKRGPYTNDKLSWGWEGHMVGRTKLVTESDHRWQFEHKNS